MRKLFVLVLGFLCPLLCAQDASRLDAQRITSGEFRLERFGPARWLDGAHYATLEPTEAGGPPELVRYEAVSGKREVLVSAAMLAVAAGPIAIEDYVLSPDQTHLLAFTQSERVWRQNTRGEYYVLSLGGKHEPLRLGGDLPKSTLMFAKWSPDGTRVGYVAQNDLYVEDVATRKRTRLTKDGSATIINGTFDWVYEEEFDCRDGFRWSPDGKHIAYWQLDCSGVGEFLMIDNLADRYSKVVPVQFPKAGTTNSSCRIGVIAAAGGETVWLDTPGDPRETYLPRMEWHPKGEELMVQWLPREQNVLQVLGGDVKTGDCRVVHEERDEAYVDVRDDFRWVEGGGKFFWTSDTAFHEGDGPRFRQCGTIEWDTRGKQMLLTHRAWTKGFDVISVDHVDIGKGTGYVSASPHGPQKYLTAMPRDAMPAGMPLRYSGIVSGLVSGEAQRGWHDYQISPDGSLAIHMYSSFDNPPVVDLVKLPSHETVRVLVDNKKLRDKYEAVAKGKNDFFDVKVADGVVLDGWVMTPPDFDASKKWPVVFHIYGEPWAQTVKDTWFLGHHLFHRWLTQQGYVVMSVDARGTPAPKGRDWRKALYQKIGVTSSQEWNEAVTALCAQGSWMDKTRLAIWGWSGGGAMTLNMLFRYPDLFCAGMSVAPATDLALYDTIYQERYCGDPRKVPEVYRECSPITFAKNLKGKLLVVHGTGDDNVHFQHSERLFDELVKHGKLFEYLAYPNRTHSIVERAGTRKHLYGSLSDFLNRRVPPGPRSVDSAPNK
ncbi:MAG TPA: DPP IV N-terminal domain-containing protein [Planctomycetota bacterium]|nr:DPP IV N-terminal domain-containing protein [Planctomycetota bacterium]